MSRPWDVAPDPETTMRKTMRKLADLAWGVWFVARVVLGGKDDDFGDASKHQGAEI